MSAEILRRDRECRRCGQVLAPGEGYAIDHIFPRRLLGPEDVTEPTNLAVLHANCHARKVRAERKLFEGDPYEFRRWLSAVRRTGPLPDDQFQARALARLTELLYGMPA